MGLFVRTCTAMQLEGFTPQELSNVIQGESLLMCAMSAIISSVDGAPSHLPDSRAGAAGALPWEGLHDTLRRKVWPIEPGHLRPFGAQRPDDGG
jgi:hypothetical protein